MEKGCIMSGDISRRTSVKLKVNGTEISNDINKYLLSFSYTDEQEDKTDDLSITIDDREGVWLSNWLNSGVKSANRASGNSGGSGSSGSSGGFSVGDSVMVKQGTAAYDGTPLQSWVYSYTGFTVVEIGKINPDRIVFGISGAITAAVHASDLIKTGSGTAAGVEKNSAAASSNGLVGAVLTAYICQKNRDSDGKDRTLYCGKFSIDTIKASGPPSKITLKGTSLSAGAAIRTVKKNKAWENIRLSGIANQIAANNGMKCSFASDFNPMYTRKEQSGESDIVFLQRLCTAAGISLKVTDGALVLFDEADYEKKAPVTTFENGKGNVLSYSFTDGASDRSYSSCHVSYTNPDTGVTIEYTYTPRIDNPGTGEVLEISERVENREEARQLAMKRLRAKNKDRFSASLKIIGDADIAAGSTVNIKGWGDFDGKYIIKTAAHSIGSGYTTSITLRKCLEGY